MKKKTLYWSTVSLIFSVVFAAALVNTASSQGGSWEQLSGAATDIGVGANGAVFTIGTNRSDGGYGIWKWTGNQWQALPGGGVRIAVDPRGTPWVVNDRGTIFQWRGGKWAKLPGTATDIGIGANGAVFVIGTERSDSGFGIFKWKRGGWQQIPGGAVNVSVGPSGTPWVTDSSNNIHRKMDKEPVLAPSVQSPELLSEKQARAKAIAILKGDPYGNTTSEIARRIVEAHMITAGTVCGEKVHSPLWHFHVVVPENVVPYGNNAIDGYLDIDGRSGEMVCARLPFLD